ncbi:hypothetical protein H4R19_001108 [Coemansia spiralis]|nr:hypothetical protein H4R19_001108 [Coemansia spiralis]
MESRVPQVPETSASNRPLVLGLGIGLPVCVLLVLLAGVLIGLRRRKRSSQHRREAGSELGGIGEWPDMVPDSWSSVGDGSFAEWLHSGASLAPTIPGAIVSDGLPKYHEVSRGGGSGSSSKRQSCAKPPPPS